MLGLRLRCRFQSLPWQFAFQEVYQHEPDRLEVVATTVAVPIEHIQACELQRTYKVIGVGSIRPMCPFGITKLGTQGVIYCVNLV